MADTPQTGWEATVTGLRLQVCQDDAGPMPSAARVRIQPDEHGFLLLRFGASGEFAGDTWHESASDAQLQAEFEFGITADQWKELR